MVEPKDIAGQFCPLSRWVVALALQEFCEEQKKSKETQRWQTQSEFAYKCFPDSSDEKAAAVKWAKAVTGSPSLNRIPNLTVYDANNIAKTIGIDLSKLLFTAERMVAEKVAFPSEVAWDVPILRK